jgi:hypothetical protein
MKLQLWLANCFSAFVFSQAFDCEEICDCISIPCPCPKDRSSQLSRACWNRFSQSLGIIFFVCIWPCIPNPSLHTRHWQWHVFKFIWSYRDPVHPTGLPCLSRLAQWSRCVLRHVLYAISKLRDRAWNTYKWFTLITIPVVIRYIRDPFSCNDAHLLYLLTTSRMGCALFLQSFVQHSDSIVKAGIKLTNSFHNIRLIVPDRDETRLVFKVNISRSRRGWSAVRVISFMDKQHLFQTFESLQ